MQPGSKMVPPPISFSNTFETRFELKSCSTIRSTLAITTSPGPVSFLPLARARIFSIMFIGADFCRPYRHKTGVGPHVPVQYGATQAFRARFRTDNSQLNFRRERDILPSVLLK